MAAPEILRRLFATRSWSIQMIHRGQLQGPIRGLFMWGPNLVVVEEAHWHPAGDHS